MARPLTIVFALVALVNLGNTLHKGGDFQVFLEAGHRTLEGRPLYTDSGPGSGVIGPPAQGVLFAPFAAIASLSETGSRLAWYVANLFALGVGLRTWTRAMSAGSDSRGHGAASALWPFIAVLLPLQTNFEHQNMSPLLLGLAGGATVALLGGRAAVAALLLGAAVAFKAFPALLVLYLLARGHWRIGILSVAVALGLSAAPVLWQGLTPTGQNWTDWLHLVAQRGWPDRIQNQSLVAMMSRATDPASADWIMAVLSVAALAGLAGFAWRMRSAGPASLAGELALALGAAVLLSPIAWDHYWVLMFPALLALHSLDGLPRRVQRTMFWVAAVLLSGLSPVTVGSGGFNLARSWSSSTLAGLLLVGCLLWMIWRRAHRPAPLATTATLS